MLKRLRKIVKEEHGQGMTEYAIIVALIAIAAIGVVTLFGDNIRALFSGSVDALAGETAVGNKGSKDEKHTKSKGLKKFSTDNEAK